MISNKTKELVWSLYEIDNLSKSEISRKVGVSRHKVIEILKDDKNRNAQVIDSVRKFNNENNQNLVRMLRDDNRLPSIANQILDMLNDPKLLAKEIERSGLRPLATVLGILSDKSLKAVELEQKRNTTDDGVTVKIINNAPDIPISIEEEEDAININ